jgi:hypothetical protein
MGAEIIFKDKIRSQVLKVLSGYCFRERHRDYPNLYLLSPWISDVQLNIDDDVYKLDELWFGLDYGIQSINLSYALLLLRLQFGADLYIVTLPPNVKNYGDSASYHSTVLDFFDEIGCNVYVNQDLHAKLILSNDLALLGSFNLSKAAFYDREEICVSLDDISNLKILDEYVKNIIESSAPYGYSANLDPCERFPKDLSHPKKITRGWLYDEIVGEYFDTIRPDTLEYDEFLKDHIGTESFYSDGVISEVASDLERFYTRAVVKLLEARGKNKRPLRHPHFLGSNIDFQVETKLEDVTVLLHELLARPHFPKIPLRMKPIQR